jgi:anti-sigma-K factor RskA
LSHEQFEEAIPLYVIGALERRERQALEAHLLTGCGACRTALEEYRPVAAKLPFALTRLPVPAELKQKLLAAIAQPTRAQESSLLSGSSPRDPAAEARQAPARRRMSPAWLCHPGWTAACLILLAVGVWYAQALHSQMGSQAAQRDRAEAAFQDSAQRLAAFQRQAAEQEEALAGLRAEMAERSGDIGEVQAAVASREAEAETLRAELATRERELAGLRVALAQRDEMLAFLRSPVVKVVSLAGLDKARTAGALLLFDPETKRAFFYAFNLPPLPGGKTYQLWAILDKPVSAGIFSTDAGQKARMIVRGAPELARITKFAVSMEPAGGRPQPTGDIYLMGQL